MRIKAKTTIRLQDKLQMPGQVVQVSDKLANKLIKAGMACPAEEKAIAPEKENSMRHPSEPKHLGGGWYQLENGSKVRKSQLESR